MKYKWSLTYSVIILLIAVALIGCTANSGNDSLIETNPELEDSVSQKPLGSFEDEILSIEELTLSEEKLRSIKDHLIQTSGIETFRYSMEAIIKTNVAGIEVKIPVSISGEFEPVDKTKSKVSINMGFVSTEAFSVSGGGKLYFANSADGKWTSSEDTAQIFSSPTVILSNILHKSGPLAVVSKEQLADVSLLHMKVTKLESLFGNIDQDIQADLWINQDNLRIYKLTLQGPVYMPDIQTYLPSQIDAREATVNVSYEFYKYQDTISIEIPEAEDYLINGRLPGTKVFEQVNLVIGFGESHPEYKSTPATSGWHYGQPDAPAPWGVHDEFLPDEVLLQNLVQGGIGLHYNCEDGCQDVIDVLAKFSEQYPKILVSPYTGMNKKIAITAWSYIDEMDEIDVGRIEVFIKAHHNSERAPEHFKP
ncbi:MAG: hypothetical protein CL883_03740 [Dehalococcoidia bacterium]|nr:hypothetical protein [Dehalococcoidia bacterium]